MLIWRGHGYMTLILLIAVVALLNFLPPYVRNMYLYCGIILLAGGLNWMAGRAMNRDMGDVPFWRRHSLFGLPVEWWTLLFVVYAIFGFVAWDSLKP